MKRIAYDILALICGGVAALLFSEWFHTGPFASSESIAKYHFGSESMRAHGGWKYDSALVYSTFAWVEAAIFMGIAALFLFAVFKKKDLFAVVAGVTWICVIGTNHFLR